ncbi:Acetyl-coenzyme A synthetase [Ralstonia mannitolilytica]|uniref:AMP-binding protein n=1 Tax=Ralstonia mannitolilytica TaxID=105219 RepID=UPI0028F55A7E|nr:AMP-binding protein [Ralstonia mannitolilytica]CAJ0802758.1 Acetyl-coenzyme A synthetase [Ralstonia mannitolilytica]
MTPLHALLSAARPDDAVVCVDGGQHIAHGAFRARVAAWAVAFAAQPAARVALCVEDPFAFACALFALLACGKHVVIPASAAPAYLESLAGAYDVLVTDAGLAAIGPHAGPLAFDAVDRHAPITLYTSGSTGTPKPIHKTLAQFDAEVVTLEQQWGMQIGTGAVVASVPHHHIYGLLFRVFWPLAAGRAFSRQTASEPAALQRALDEQPVAALVSSPAQLARWPQLPGFEALPPMPAVFSSGGPLDAAAAAAFAAAHGSAPIEVFGSTETGGIAWRRQDQSLAWQPFASVAIRQEADGALAVRSPHLPHDDWHRTDDAIAFDDSGRFILRGRLDRVVKVDGKRVSLPEMEDWLGTHPFVARAAATLLAGASRERLGALVALTPAGVEALRTQGRVALAKTLRRHLSAYTEPTLIPRRWRFCMALPVDARGKLPASAVAAAFRPGAEGFETLAHVSDAEGDHYELRVSPSLIHFEGHFPGLPILPGVVLIDWAIRLAAARNPAVRAIISVDQLKFMAPVPPGAVVSLRLAHEPERCRVRFTARLGARDCASGAFVHQAHREAA